MILCSIIPRQVANLCCFSVTTPFTYSNIIYAVISNSYTLYRELELQYIFKFQFHMPLIRYTFFVVMIQTLFYTVLITNSDENSWFRGRQAEDINLGQKNLRYTRYWTYTTFIMIKISYFCVKKVHQ